MAGPGPRANPLWVCLALPNFPRKRLNPISRAWDYTLLSCPKLRSKGQFATRDRAVFDIPDVPSPRGSLPIRPGGLRRRHPASLDHSSSWIRLIQFSMPCRRCSHWVSHRRPQPVSGPSSTARNPSGRLRRNGRSLHVDGIGLPRSRLQMEPGSSSRSASLLSTWPFFCRLTLRHVCLVQRAPARSSPTLYAGVHAYSVHVSSMVPPQKKKSLNGCGMSVIPPTYRGWSTKIGVLLTSYS